MAVFRRFKADQSGSTAVIFGLSLLPLIGLAGGAVDYSRAGARQTDMQRALDATVLALTKEPTTSSQAALDLKTQKLFASTFRGGDTFELTSLATSRPATNTIKVAAAGTVKSAFMGLLGFPTMPVSVEATATFGTPNIEIALVLDNTGSMADLINGQRKIDALKDQAKALLASLRNLTTEPGRVKVSVVPFDTEVRLDAAQYRSKNWFRWNDAGHDPQAWTGYVFDRYGSYATTDAPPIASVIESLYPAPRASDYGSDLAPMRPLTALRGSRASDTTDYDALVAVVNGMRPRGNTNIALGMMWGFATLTPSEPFTEAASTGTTKKYQILLTDGDNTMNHVNGRPSSDLGQMNASTSTACSRIKGAGIETFTILLLQGDENLLRACASPNGPNDQHYFNVQNVGDLTVAFRKILDSISGTRLSM